MPRTERFARSRRRGDGTAFASPGKMPTPAEGCPEACNSAINAAATPTASAITVPLSPLATHGFLDVFFDNGRSATKTGEATQPHLVLAVGGGGKGEGAS
jgi:hypothetical protein